MDQETNWLKGKVGKSLHRKKSSIFQIAAESCKSFFQCEVKWPFRVIIYKALEQFLEAFKARKCPSTELGNIKEAIDFE